MAADCGAGAKRHAGNRCTAWRSAADRHSKYACYKADARTAIRQHANEWRGSLHGDYQSRRVSAPESPEHSHG
jgi:hypothetical protein